MAAHLAREWEVSMAKYIELEAALKLLRVSAVKKYPSSFYVGILAAAQEIENMPAADVVLVTCKIGDAVYGIRNYKGKTSIQKGFISELFFTKDMKLMVVVKHVCRGHWLEKVFPTREAAEAAMRKEGE